MSGPEFSLDVLTPETDEWYDFKVETNSDDPAARDTPGELAELLSDMCRGEYDPERVMNFAEEASHLIGLRENETGGLVGFLLLSARNDAAQEASVNLICVSEDVKGKGLSKLLLDKAKEISRDAGKDQLVLDAANEKVAKIYESNGFIRDPGYKSKYDMDTTLHMVYDLAQTASSRLNRKTKRTKRNRRNLKRSKLRKLTTRRR